MDDGELLLELQVSKNSRPICTHDLLISSGLPAAAAVGPSTPFSVLLLSASRFTSTMSFIFLRILGPPALLLRAPVPCLAPRWRTALGRALHRYAGVAVQRASLSTGAWDSCGGDKSNEVPMGRLLAAELRRRGQEPKTPNSVRGSA